MLGLKRLSFAVAAVAALSIGVAAASADSIDPYPSGSPGILNLTGSFTSVGVTYYEYSVDMEVTGGNSVITGDQFAIFDVLGSNALDGFGSASANSSLPAGSTWSWTHQSSTTYHIGGTTAQDASATLGDMIFEYSGAPITTTTSGPAVDLGTFGFLSSIDLTTGSTVYGGAIYNSKPNGGAATDNQVNGDSWIASVPNPAAAWGGMGLLGLLGAAKARARRQNV